MDIQHLTTGRQNIGQSDNLSTVVFGVDFTLDFSKGVTIT